MDYPEIGKWSVLKNEIIDKYTQAYLTIMNHPNQEWCKSTLYVDAFAGAPENRVRGTDEIVPGSAKRALSWKPGFSEYYFVDADSNRAQSLRELAQDRADVTVFNEDGNSVLLNHIVPRLQRRYRRRGFVLLDPYGLQLDWNVVQGLGETRSADVVINFPTMDINRNAARRDPLSLSDIDAARMTKWWGSGDWRERFYGQGPKPLVGEPKIQKIVNNDDIVTLYRNRLMDEGQFRFVTQPFETINAKKATLYYLLLASNNQTAVDIMDQILDKYRKPKNLSLFE